MGMWSDQVVPRLTDLSLSADGISRLRVQACAGLRGRVLELGFGSGLNLPWLPPEVTALDAVDPSGVGWSRSARRRAACPVPVERLGLDGQRLAAPDASYDAVLATFTLCTIPDPAAALAEVRRVLRPGGDFHFLEHGLAPEAGVVRWQQRLEPVQRRLAGGCHLTRDVPALVREAGLEMVALRAEYLPGPRVSHPWTYAYVGRARRPAA
ncbi:class I SAM-dependent methyltransferase [Nocardioides panaciterrulae]|uniref:SAM-dependent methyltransferase n=1 Tax=Nocardioides panaciterrulae TaxID=661492 RepID=A0A7Y9JAI5_9ACTN|nr:class I SAM-dependent methyltransferase [Nocardioides panaciterrulae]NYD41860.1 SAM-dependent methyltransferase [Nocardioides panaciterrulae]